MPSGQVTEIGETHRRGTKICFKPDTTIFEVTEFNFETLSQRLRELAFLNAGLQITISDERSGKEHEFKFEGGIVRSSSTSTRAESVRSTRSPSPCARRGRPSAARAVEIALQWNDGYDESIFTFANNINTHEGGTHLVGFKAALTRTINATRRRAGCGRT